MIDFFTPVKILALATQGRADASQWVTRYYLTYGFDGINFVPYMCRKVRNYDLKKDTCIIGASA